MFYNVCKEGDCFILAIDTLCFSFIVTSLLTMNFNGYVYSELKYAVDLNELKCHSSDILNNVM